VRYVFMDFNPRKRKIFDVHSHIGRFGRWELKQNNVEIFRGREIPSFREQEAFMRRLGIDKAIVMPHYTPDQNIHFDVYNPLVLEAVSRLENVLGALWVSPLPENTNKTQAVLDSLPVRKIVALKMSPDSWPKGKYTPDPGTWDAGFRANMESIIDAAKKYNLPIQTHTGSNNSDMMQYVPFVDEYGKKTRIHFVHMGGVAGSQIAFVPRFISWLKKGYDFYCDTSFCKGFGPAWLISEMQDRYPAGLDRIMFASDNPWGIFESEFWRVEAVDCSDKIKEKIFYDNAAKIYGN
jgi:hypothetical protein